MLDLDNAAKRKVLQAEREKADIEIGNTLTRDARDFQSPADLRSQLNQARAVRDWASQQLTLMEQQQLR